MPEQHEDGMAEQRVRPADGRWLGYRERGYPGATRGMSESDRQVMRRPEVCTTLIRDLAEAYRQVSDAQIVDGTLAMTATRWGFDLAGISILAHVWHGEQDRPATRARFDRRAAELPGARAHLVHGAGHLLDTDSSVVDGVRSAVRECARWLERGGVAATRLGDR